MTDHAISEQKYRNAIDTLRAVDAPASVASFLESVWELGCYLDTKVYSKRALTECKLLDKVILRLAADGALIESRQGRCAELLFAIATIKQDINGHDWRVRRIFAEQVLYR